MARGMTKKTYLIAGIVAVAGLAFSGWSIIIAAISLDESATPPTSEFAAAPAGAEVIHRDRLCGSGGCWQEATIAPADGESPVDLAGRMGLTSESCSPGNILDPRYICRGSTVRNGMLVVYVSYWSRGY